MCIFLSDDHSKGRELKWTCSGNWSRLTIQSTSPYLMETLEQLQTLSLYREKRRTDDRGSMLRFHMLCMALECYKRNQTPFQG